MTDDLEEQLDTDPADALPEPTETEDDATAGVVTDADSVDEE